jgi:hypothetical protein
MIPPAALATVPGLSRPKLLATFVIAAAQQDTGRIQSETSDIDHDI